MPAKSAAQLRKYRIMVVVCEDDAAESALRDAVVRAQLYGADRMVAQVLAGQADKIHIQSSGYMP